MEQSSAAAARQFGRGIIRTFKLDEMELYPKQHMLKTGPDSLVRLPVAIHQLTGKRYHFITPDGPSLSASNTAGETVSDRVKARITVKAFISQFVDLNAQNRGYCPFHDDSRMSFGVNEAKNFWHCFAGCGGGSIIDFWQRWRELHGQDDSFAATVKDLATILL